jgi:hypothetical protein
MSQPFRSTLATLGLMAALVLAVPAPSRAAGLRQLPTVQGIAAGAWAWLESLLPMTPQAMSHRRIEMRASATASLTPTPPPETSAAPSEQGSMIDPNGSR